MFCRNCGNEIQAGSKACMKCGCDPRDGTSFCPNCGVATSEKQIICVKCNANLKKSFFKLIRPIISKLFFGDFKEDIEKVHSMNPKNRILAGLYAIFLGLFGIDDFYLGKYLRGIVRLFILIILFMIQHMFQPSSSSARWLYAVEQQNSFLSLPALIILLILFVFSLIVGIKYLTMSDKAFDETYVHKNKK